MQVNNSRFSRITPQEINISQSFLHLPQFQKNNDFGDIFYQTPETSRVQKTQLPPLPPLPSAYNKRTNINSNDEKLLNLISKYFLIDKMNYGQVTNLLNSIIQIVSQENFSTKQSILDSLFHILNEILSEQPPFSTPLIYFKFIHFPPKQETTEIPRAYKLTRDLMEKYPSKIPLYLIRTLIRRLSSASVRDRRMAKSLIIDLDFKFNRVILKNISNLLLTPPVHGMLDILDLTVWMLNRNQTQDGDILDDLYNSLKICHLSPHYPSYHDALTKVFLALIERDDKYAIDLRMFILNHWTRKDPPRSVLYMKEATAISVVGPPLDEYVWQRFAYRASSIYMPLALEGLNYVTQTKDRSIAYNNEILRYLLVDTIENHWSRIVRDKAESTLQLLEESEPKPPKKLPIDIWISIKEQAKENYPDDEFSNSSRNKRLKKRVAKKNVENVV